MVKLYLKYDGSYSNDDVENNNTEFQRGLKEGRPDLMQILIKSVMLWFGTVIFARDMSTLVKQALTEEAVYRIKNIEIVSHSMKRVLSQEDVGFDEEHEAVISFDFPLPENTNEEKFLSEFDKAFYSSSNEFVEWAWSDLNYQMTTIKCMKLN